MKDAIRLTNKTAIALRRSAQRVRTAHYAAVALLSLAAAVLSVLWGLKWLPAVPLTLALAAMLDAAILIHSRSVYLQMIGQAICTEAAAREIRAGSSESLRREKALSDLMAVKADVEKPAQKKTPGVKPFFEKMDKRADDEEKDLYDEETPMDESDEDEDMAPAPASSSLPAPRRRRRQAGLQIIRSQQAK